MYKDIDKDYAYVIFYFWTIYKSNKLNTYLIVTKYQ